MILFRLDRDAPHRYVTGLLGRGVDVAQDSGGQYWLRIRADNQELQRELAKLPGSRFECSAEGRLTRTGDLVASQLLESELDWNGLDNQLHLDLPVAALAGRVQREQSIPLQLVRGGSPEEAVAAIIELDALLQWVQLASEIRLRSLRWVCRGDMALCMGRILPPVAATYLVALGRVLIPAGLAWQPAVSSSDVCELFGASTEDWLVWESNEIWSSVPNDAFASMRRASVRRAVLERLSSGNVNE